MKAKLFASIPGSPTKGEDRVKITSAFNLDEVYVSRLVKSSGSWGKKRWLIKRNSIRREEPPTDHARKEIETECVQFGIAPVLAKKIASSVLIPEEPK